MWQRFSERARKVVFYAQEEGQRFGEGFVSTEHLLLGLIREESCVGVRVLEQLGINLDRVRQELEKQLPRSDHAHVQEMTLTPRAKRVIDLAYDEARNLGNNYIGTEHLLLGLIREDDGLAGRVLLKLGAELEKTRATVAELQDAETAGRPPRPVPQSQTKDGLLAKREWSTLIVIDMQDSFLAPIVLKDRVLKRTKFLIEIAKLLDVPIIATEQYPERMGGTNGEIAELLSGAPVYGKLCFSSCRSADFARALHDTQRLYAVIVGIETHICVTQTALDLLRDEMRVFVCADAVASRFPEFDEVALERLRDEGATISHTESVAYEWLGEAGTPEFKKALEIVKKYA